MLDPIAASGAADTSSISQIESAMWVWPQEAFVPPSTRAYARRYYVDVPLHASAAGPDVAQNVSGYYDATMEQALPNDRGKTACASVV